ncbi:MAG: DUF309 domain-containing protein [Bacillaceae bacterium]
MYVKPYIDYYIQFHQIRDYFECHEILEEYWKKDISPDRDGWVVLIQLAVGMYHYRRENRVGATKMIKSVCRHLPIYEQKLKQLGINYTTLQQLTTELLSAIVNGIPYKSVAIPLTDLHLLEYLHFKASLTNQPLYATSNMKDTYLLHKHTKRDRTAVIQERITELNKRKKRSESL